MNKNPCTVTHLHNSCKKYQGIAILLKDTCIKNPYSVTHYDIYIKGSMFFDRIFQLMDSGVARKLIDTWQPKASYCKSLEIEPLTLPRVFTAFLLLGTGILFSLLVLAGENFSKKLQQGSPAGVSWRRELERREEKPARCIVGGTNVNNGEVRTTARIGWVYRTGFKKRV